MADSLADNVRELLDKEKGDKRILKQILRACENNELVSNYERNYVKKLAERHLGHKPAAIPATGYQKTLHGTAGAHVASKAGQTQKTMPPAKPAIPNSTRKNTRIFVGLGILAMAIIVAVALVAMSPAEPPTVPDDPPTAAFSIHTDLSAYQKGDIVSISGRSPMAESVNISITNPGSQTVWSEQVDVKSDGRYSTLAIAGGSGWEESGTFVITAENSSGASSSAFSFAN